MADNVSVSWSEFKRLLKKCNGTLRLCRYKYAVTPNCIRVTRQEQVAILQELLEGNQEIFKCLRL